MLDKEVAYCYFEFKCTESEGEMIGAFCTELGFEAFEEEDGGLKAYIGLEKIDDCFENRLREMIPFEVDYIVKGLEDRNWNEEWEASFEPVIVGDFCSIRADFHPKVEGVRYDLVINPKMAFGTGHHETTYMMIERMEKVAFEGKRVLDFGSGTGVLAILAEKMGAERVTAIDNDENAYENALENVSLNGCHKVDCGLGGLEILDEDVHYDVILANINRNVLLDSVDGLKGLLKDGGVLILSGILRSDVALVVGAYEGGGFEVGEVSERGEWVCVGMGS